MSILVQFVSVIAFTTWGLYVWIKVKDYGPGPFNECNDQIKYVVFFVTVRATAPWLRGVWIGGLVLSAAGLMVSFGIKTKLFFAMKRLEEEVRAEKTNSIARRASPAEAPSTPSHEEPETSEKQWYFHVSLPLLLCVAPLFSLIRVLTNQITAQFRDILHDHAGAYGEWP